jgi:hypothetical protein
MNAEPCQYYLTGTNQEDRCYVISATNTTTLRSNYFPEVIISNHLGLLPVVTAPNAVTYT